MANAQLNMTHMPTRPETRAELRFSWDMFALANRAVDGVDSRQQASCVKFTRVEIASPHPRIPQLS